MTIPQQLFLAVLQADGSTCVYCGHHGPDVTVSHVLPPELQGPTVLQNLATCCPTCRARQGTHVPYEVGLVAHHGRFAYVAHAVAAEYSARRRRSRVDASVMRQYIAALLRSGLTANQIFALVGGQRASTLATIAAVRQAEANDAHEEAAMAVGNAGSHAPISIQHETTRH